jgi:hypothetical protein
MTVGNEGRCYVKKKTGDDQIEGESLRSVLLGLSKLVGSEELCLVNGAAR